MSIYKGTELLAGIATDTISNANYLLDFKWSDHIINSMEWLRADTFSWQSGDVYVAAYNHLVADYSGGTSQTETVGSYTITYVLATDGHKITTDETNAVNIYNATGVAWYYILDTTNQRFKLPRENPAREELIQVIRAKGNGNSLMLTAGSYDLYMSATATSGIGGKFLTKISPTIASTTSAQSGYTTNNYAASGGCYGFGVTTDSTKSGIISSMTDSTSVYKGKKYLYFYVGQFSQSATEQTAGLNSELFNGKVDLNAANLSTQGKSLISRLGMPSATYDDLTLGASGTTYTAPANGYYFLHKAGSGAGQYLTVINKTSSGDVSEWQHICYDIFGGSQLTCLMPAKKGDKIHIGYSLGGTTYTFRFIYAEGEV